MAARERRVVAEVTSCRASSRLERYLLDSMIFDKIVDTPGALELAEELTAQGKIDFVTTHVQEDEHSEADPERAARLASVPRSRVPTSVFVIGVSPLNGGRLGNEEPFESLRGTKKHTKDGMIAATAEYEGVPLVTEEKRLTGRARQQGIEVWNWERLLKRMHELARDLAAS
jgi:hypothetical protein